MGQEQGKTTMSEPAFAETPGQHSLSIKNRFLLYENNYLRCINNLLNEIGQENAVVNMHDGLKECQRIAIASDMEQEKCDIAGESNTQLKGSKFVSAGKSTDAEKGYCRCCIHN